MADPEDNTLSIDIIIAALKVSLDLVEDVDTYANPREKEALVFALEKALLCAKNVPKVKLY